MTNVLFLCTGNSARSILFEAVLRHEGAGRFRAFSAGSHPKGVVNPHAIAALARHGYATDGLRSKSWEEFAAADAPVMDIVVTACDAAAGEACPLWPGSPVRAHWGLPDPAAAPQAEAGEAFEAALAQVRTRVAELLSFDVGALDRAGVQARIRAIGDMALRGSPRS